MWIVDAVFTRPRTMHMEEMTLPQAVWIGAAQILSAIFPVLHGRMSTSRGQVAGSHGQLRWSFVFFYRCLPCGSLTGYISWKTVMPHHHEGNIAPLKMNPHQWIVLVSGLWFRFCGAGCGGLL